MQTKKINCWEFKKCGRQPGGSKVSESNVCPAATETKVDGVNGGKNGGRACWAIAGTLCDDKVQGTFASKVEDCFNCKFYELVKNEEGPNFKRAKGIFEKLLGLET